MAARSEYGWADVTDPRFKPEGQPPLHVGGALEQRNASKSLLTFF
jgi:hypothetical protein